MDPEDLDSPYEFLGTHRHALDTKGRIVLPSAFRRQLEQGEVIMTIGLECVAVHPRIDWERVKHTLLRHHPSNAQEARLQRLIPAKAVAQTLDRQGRITVPPDLRTHAGLEPGGAVDVVGQIQRIELWNVERWEVYQAETLSGLRPGSEQLYGFGMF